MFCYSTFQAFIAANLILWPSSCFSSRYEDGTQENSHEGLIKQATWRGSCVKIYSKPPCIDVSSVDDTNLRFCCFYFRWAGTDQVSHKIYIKRDDLHKSSKLNSTRYPFHRSRPPWTTPNNRWRNCIALINHFTRKFTSNIELYPWIIPFKL